MSLTELNIDDLSKLKQFRLERFLHFFTSTLPSCLVQIDPSNHILSLHCPHSRVVEELLSDLEDLHYYAWLMLGVSEIVLYLCREEVLRTSISH